MNWQITQEEISREEAVRKIFDNAREQGIASGTFKVYYGDNQVVAPEDLPQMVDMTKVRISQVLDNA